MARKMEVEFERAPTDDEPLEAFRRAHERVAQAISSPTAVTMLREMREYAEMQRRLKLHKLLTERRKGRADLPDEKTG
jgi:hypothetical protein